MSSGRRGRRGRPGRLAGAALFVALVAGACDTPTLPADGEGGYLFTLQGTSKILRWPTGSVIRVFVAAGSDPERIRVLEEGLDHGIRVWNEAALYEEFRVERAPNVQSADVVLAWSNVELPIDVTDCDAGGGGAAVTTFCLHPQDTTRLKPFPILPAHGEDSGRPRMLVLVRSTEIETPEGVPRLVAHELGHVLGIGRHSPDSGDLMWSGVLSVDAPTAADRATVRTLYQTRPDIEP